MGIMFFKVTGRNGKMTVKCHRKDPSLEDKKAGQQAIWNDRRLKGINSKNDIVYHSYRRYCDGDMQIDYDLTRSKQSAAA
jgi:hypothetical protein